MIKVWDPVFCICHVTLHTHTPQWDNSATEFVAKVEDQATLCMLEEDPITEDNLKSTACSVLILIGLALHLSLLGFYPETWQVCKLSINLLTLAGLSRNISADKPATISRCMVKS